MTLLGRLALLLVLMTNSVMADFTVTVDTSSITITWDASTVSGLTDFNITLDDEVKYTGSNTAGSYQITGLTAGTSYHLVITTNDGSTATPVDKTQYTIPNKPTLKCAEEEEAITIDITKGAGKVDKLSLTCSNCNDTSRHEDEIHQHRYTNLVPYTTYTFKATAIAGSQSNHLKESAIFTKTCKTSEGPPYAVRGIVVTYATPLQLHLSWTEPKVKNGELLKYTVTYNGTYNGKKTDMPEDQTKVLIVSDASKETYAMNITGLKHGYMYIFVVRAYNKHTGLPSNVTFSMPATSSTPVPWGAIGGGLGAAVFVIVVFLLRRRGFFVKKEQSSSDTFINLLYASNSKQKPDTSHQIKLVDFPDHWKRMNADSQLQFAAVYEDLKPVGTEQPQKIALLPVNRAKNRFTNVLPYDKTRIKLMSGGEEEEGTDYINGNWMPGYNSKREYAVVQGPLPGTKDDMWRMIWEHKASAIVMLTKCVENGRERCDQYWPVDAQPVYFGHLKVEILTENKTIDWIISTMKVSQGSQSRNITHFQYNVWPSFGTPDPQSLIGFVRLVRRSLEPVGGPIVVHCSAGVGRSGTFIALDRLLQHIEEHDWVDIYNTVYEMRLYRNLMVQTEAQYVCIHSCLLCVLEGQEDSDDEGEDNEDDEGYKVIL